MGMLKQSIRGMPKQAKEIERTMPPMAARMAAAQARMADLNQMMANQAQAANAAAPAEAGAAGPAPGGPTRAVTRIPQGGTRKLRQPQGVDPAGRAHRPAPCAGP